MDTTYEWGLYADHDKDSPDNVVEINPFISTFSIAGNIFESNIKQECFYLSYVQFGHE